MVLFLLALAPAVPKSLPLVAVLRLLAAAVLRLLAAAVLRLLAAAVLPCLWHQWCK
jgi:hypothetical protein